MVNEPSKEERLDVARNLVVALENDDHDAVDQLMSELARLQETCLFQEIGKLTRQLHDAMQSFSLDVRIADFAESEIPDARERLQYVMTMTEQAANTTLSQVEGLAPVSKRLRDESSSLGEKWDLLLNRQLPYAEFRELSLDLKEYLKYVQTESRALHDGLNEILMAQGFQDITSQIIRRVIDLVQDIERSMVDLIKLSGGVPGRKSKKAEEHHLEGPIIPGVNDNDSLGNQDDVDELLSSLGF